MYLAVSLGNSVPACVGRYEGNRGFLVATKPLKAGEEVRISYGEYMAQIKATHYCSTIQVLALESPAAWRDRPG